MTMTLPQINQWIATLTSEERALLAAHTEDARLPDDVVELLRAGPVSPMTTTVDGESHIRMPIWVREALQAHDATQKPPEAIGSER